MNGKSIRKVPNTAEQKKNPSAKVRRMGYRGRTALCKVLPLFTFFSVSLFLVKQEKRYFFYIFSGAEKPSRSMQDSRMDFAREMRAI